MSRAKRSRVAQPTRATAQSHPSQTLQPWVEFMDAHQLSEIEWQQGDTKIRLRRGVHSEAHVGSVMLSPGGAAATGSAAAGVGAPSAVPSNRKTVTSPFVGTFYRSSRPGSEPYVQEGGAVKAGDVLCIVEAMKLMNEIESEYSGRVVSILVENGTPVEFGEPLFVIET